MALVQHGKFEDIIYAQFDPGADLMLSLHEVCKQEDVITGVVLDITGAMSNLYIEHFPALGSWAMPKVKEGADLDSLFLNMEGPLEVSGHGLIGEGWAPGVTPPDPRGFYVASFKEHGDPYFHVHITGTNAETTACGHLLEGSMILGGEGSPSHFTVVIAKVTGLKLRAVWEETEETGTAFWHELTATAS